jgi:hypothetical protein
MLVSPYRQPETGTTGPNVVDVTLDSWNINSHLGIVQCLKHTSHLKVPGQLVLLPALEDVGFFITYIFQCNSFP